MTTVHFYVYVFFGGVSVKKLCQSIVKGRFVIMIVALILLIPSVLGYVGTKINYNLIEYLPSETETIQAQKILQNEFDIGDYAIIITEDMSAKQILQFEEQIRDIKGVNLAGSVYDVIGTSFPLEVLPSDISSKVKKDQSNLVIVLLQDSISSDGANEVVTKIRSLSDSIKTQGLTAMNLDNAELADSEVMVYVVIAVLLCLIVLNLSLDSFATPVLILLNIGIAILYNMGSNIFLGQISYITKAIAAVLQLGVTLDFSIFLYHKYESAKDSGLYSDKEEAMAAAIEETMVSVVGSSLTTIAGFLALCTMQLTLGVDIGVVMAKGVAFGVICVLTVLPALILIFDGLIVKTSHKVLLPHLGFVKNVVAKAFPALLAVFLIGMGPAYYGQAHTKSYYNLSRALPQNLPSIVAKDELAEKFNIVSPYIIFTDSTLPTPEMKKMVRDLEKVEGIDFVLSFSKLEEIGISENALSDDVKSAIDNGEYKLMLVNSLYETATNELNGQIEEVNTIVKKYDKKAMLCGEGPLMKDMVLIADQDFHNVNYTSIAVIFVIMIIILRSISLPVLLIAAIEFAIFINMGIPYYTGVSIPFVASIVIGTIQLGATIDYAILMSTKYLEKRQGGYGKKEAINEAVDASVNSIFVSAMCFFAATFGVSILSSMEIISSICTLISRGALISMMTVGFIVPSLLMVCDPIIVRTTLGFKELKAHGYKSFKN